MQNGNSDPGMQMLEAIRSEDLRQSEQSITNFKQFIKRNLVDLDMIQPYISALISVYPVRELSVLTFSTFCHLIKRISFQDPAALQMVYEPILPFLLERLSEHKDSIRLTSVKSLKTCIECAPNGNIDDIIFYFVKYGVMSNQLRVQTGVLDILYQILESANSFQFSFKQLLDSLVLLLMSSDEEIAVKSNQLLVFYFTKVNPTNNAAKSDLVNSLLQENVPYENASILLNSIDQNLYEQYINFVNPPPAIVSNANLTEAHPKLNSREMLENLLAKVPNWSIDDSNIQADENCPQADPSYEGLYAEYEPHFEDKETEKNWKYRQSYIIKIRQILRGKNVLINAENFIHLLNNTKEWIMKGMVSLRTTLSNNSCQLCKELGIYLGAFLDTAFIEYLLAYLLRLTAARKVIQHQNSNVAIISLLLYTNFNNRIFNLLSTSSQDKNIQPRTYTAKWIQFLLLKFYDPENTDVFHSFIDAVESLIVKGLSDPIPMVKDAMRNTFWTLCELEPTYENKIIKKLDVPIVKALERSKGSFVSNLTRRVPIKELIKEKLATKPNSPLNFNTQQQLMRPVSQHKLSYEPIRKTTRSESLDVGRLTEKKARPSVRHHTIGTESLVQDQIYSANRDNMINKSDFLKDSTNVNVNSRDEEYDDFTDRIKRENVIYEEITSDSSDVQKAGLLKLLKENDATITVKFHSALNQLTVINPQIFEMLFIDGNENAFVKISNYISTENMVRVFCLYLINSSDFQRVDLIVGKLPLEDLCLSITNLLNFAIDTSKLDNIILSIQFIKNRYSIITSILQIFNVMISLKKDELKSYLVSSIFESLFASFRIIKIDDEIKKKYSQTFFLCLNEFHDLFLNTINSVEDVALKNEICGLVGLENHNSVIEDVNVPDDDNVSMTEAVQYENQDNHGHEEQMIEVQNQTSFMKEITDEEQKSHDNNNADHENEMNIAEDVSELSEIPAYELEEVSTVKIDEIPQKIDEKKEEQMKSDAHSESEAQEGEENNTVLIVEEGTDISMHQNDSEISGEDETSVRRDKVDQNMESAPNFDLKAENEIKEELVNPVHEISTQTNDNGQDVKEEDEYIEETEHDDVAASVEAEKSLSDSTPDLHMLTIDETEIVDGYLGVILEVLSEDSVEIEDLTFEDLQLQSLEDYRKLYRMVELKRVDLSIVYERLIDVAGKGNFVVECLAIMRYIGIKVNENEILKFFNTLIGEKADVNFIAVYENVRLISLKSLLSIEKMKNFQLRMQEIILRCIFEILNSYAHVIDGEDIFMIETFVKRTVTSNDTFIRMYSYDIYRELYQIHYRGEVDNQGIELVDKVMFEGIDEKLMKYCTL